MNGSVEHTIFIPASTKHLAEVREFVADFARKAGFLDTDIEDIRLAVDEACTNIIKHAYKYDSSKNIQVKVTVNNHSLTISLLDNGISFEPGSNIKPDLQENLRQKKRGGMGIYLIRKFMNQVEYRNTGSGNEIRMIKQKA